MEPWLSAIFITAFVGFGLLAMMLHNIDANICEIAKTLEKMEKKQ